MLVARARQIFGATAGKKYSVLPTGIAAVGLCWSLVQIVLSPPSLAQATVLILVCYLLTDIISGLLHVVLDNPRSLDVGPLYKLAIGFQRHHDNPRTIFEMSLYDHLYVMHLPLAILFGVVLALGALVGPSGIFFVTYLVMFVMLHLMQMSHRWAHMPCEEVPEAVQRLQRVGLLLRREHHDEHHRPPHENNFCIMTGICDPLVNAIVRRFGHRSHWYNAVFLGVALLPLVTAFALARWLV